MAIPKRGRPSTARAASPAARPAKKAKVDAPGLSKKIAAIKDALMDIDALSPSMRKMLCVGLADCFANGKDDRHAVQTSVVEWIGQALAGHENTFKEQLASGQAKCAAAAAEKEGLDRAKSDADNVVVARETVVSSKKADLKEADANMKAAEAARAEAEKAQKDGDRELASVEQKSASLIAARTDAFLPLKEGSALPANSNRLSKVTLKVGEECDFDAAMLKSLPEALSKKPDERGTFDHMVVEQYEEEYRKATEAFNMAIRTGTPGKEERAAKVEAAKGAVDSSCNLEVAAKEALTVAQAELKAAETDADTAKDQVKDFVRANKATTIETECKDKELKNLQKGALAFFEDLKSWDGKPPEKKAPQYKTIKGRRYDWQLLDIAKKADPASGITKETAEALFTSALDGPGVTATEKRTLKYIIKNFKIDEESKSYLETKMGTSWYQSIDGVTYERNLLTMAAEAAQPLSLDVAQKLWESAMDSDEVTPTEKASLEYILNHYTFAEDASAFLKGKLGEAEVIAD